MDDIASIAAITQSETVKAKRTVRRSKITKLGGKLEDLQKLPLHEISPSDLQALKDELSHDIKIHTALQGRYEALIEETLSEADLIKEMSKSEDVQDIHGSLTKQILALIDRHSTFVSCLDLVSDVEQCDKLNPKTKEGKDAIESTIDTILLHLKTKRAFSRDDQIDPLLKSLQGHVDRLTIQLNKLREEYSTEREPKSDEPPRTERIYYEKSRFNLDLPKFSGKLLDWQPFYNLFTSTMKSRGTHLDNNEKCCLLQVAMVTEEAKRIVLLHSKGKDGYNDAIQALTDNYGNPFLVYPCHVRTTQTRETLDFTREGLRKARERIMLPLKAMEEMGAATLEQYLAALVAEDFSTKLKEEWMRHTAGMSSLPTATEMFKFFQPLELTMAKSESEKDASSITKSHSSRKSTSSTSTSNKPCVSKSQCVLCLEHHSLNRCPVFQGYDVTKRMKFIKDKHWCTNCLHPSHTCSNCTSSFTCKHCKQKHHTLLHRDDSSSTPSSNGVATVASSHSSTEIKSIVAPPTVAFLNTALVNAINGGRSQRARIALDTGASSSLITESLASHLKLKRYPKRLVIEGAYGGGISRHYVQVQLQSIHNPMNSMTLKLSVIPKLPTAYPPLRREDIATDPHLKDLELADPDFGGPLDVLVGSLDCCKCLQGSFTYHADPDIAVSPSIFGWTVTGPMDYEPPTQLLKLQVKEDVLHQDLQRLWELEKTPETPQLSNNDEIALFHFRDTHKIEEDGRYKVQVPRITDTPTLGESRHIAIKRFLQNERSLKKRGKLDEFNAALREYVDLDHAEIVPHQDLTLASYYLPVHGVFKETSTTTKVRPVFDASAKSSTGVSLNDLLHTGPNLYPLLTDVLIRFRSHLIGVSADISKMFREVLLHEGDRDLHRFLIRTSDGQINDFRMKRLTFGVRPSPFLATQVIRDLAEKHLSTHPEAARAILSDFYVDDYLAGASTVEEAKHLREQLCNLLSLAGMKLRKWRTSNSEFRDTIPSDLIETEDLMLPASDQAPKALGMHWDVSQDHLHVSTPTIDSTSAVTKRTIASISAKVFDVLGLFSPAVIQAKILLQRLWKLQTSWDEEAPIEIQQLWTKWVEELPAISAFPVSRRYTLNNQPVIAKALHGFADASNTAYGAVVYLRQLHQDTSVSVSLVISKARVAPLKVVTTPRAELVAAYLLAKLLSYVSNILNVTECFAWSDSTIVLSWLKKVPSTLKTFVSHRVAAIQELIPASKWHHVSTTENPADLLSRGIPASQLQSSSLWWQGPSWLRCTPEEWPKPHFVAPSKLPEVRAVINFTPSTPLEPFDLWERYSSFENLIRIVAWMKRFSNNAKATDSHPDFSDHLSSKETISAKKLIIRCAQEQTFGDVFRCCIQGKNVPKAHSLSKYLLFIDSDGLLRISSRVRDVSNSRRPRQLIPLSLKSPITKLMLSSFHRIYQHAGIATLMSIVGETYHIPGLRNELKRLSRQCTICQRAYAQPTHQQMGLLPNARTVPSPPFDSTGVDFAGPFAIRQGHTRRPVILKSYACLFTCFTTRAVHLELCADLSTEEFLAALRRFCARRGTPSHIYSDNGSNFIGARNEIRELQRLSFDAKPSLSHFCTESSIEWHFIPPKTPHFGGLWESSVKNMKTLLRKIVSPHPLRFHELNSVLTEVEAILNSRPLVPLHSTDPSDNLTLTPGHFLIGRPIKALPTASASQAKISSLRRWNLVQRLNQDLWHAWKSSYVQSLGARNKWMTKKRNLQVGDLVYVKDESLTSRNWPLARIIAVFPGDDGNVRAVDIKCQGRIYRRSTHQLIFLFEKDHSGPPVCSGSDNLSSQEQSDQA